MRSLTSRMSSALILDSPLSEAPKTTTFARNIRVTPFPDGDDASQIAESNIYKLAWNKLRIEAPKTSTNDGAICELRESYFCETESGSTSGA